MCAINATKPQKGQEYLCVVNDPNDVANYFRGVVRVLGSLVEGVSLVKVIHAQSWGGQRSSKPGHRFLTRNTTLKILQ